MFDWINLVLCIINKILLKVVLFVFYGKWKDMILIDIWRYMLYLEEILMWRFLVGLLVLVIYFINIFV